jgi:YD repeat-containing protein
MTCPSTNSDSAQSYEYDHWGNLSKTTDVLGNATSILYDLRGRKTSMSSPDMGTWVYTYDNLGQLLSQKDAKLQTTTFAYDLLGRMTQQSAVSLISNWYYEKNKALATCTMGIGKLCEATSDNNYSRKYTYDSLGRKSSVSEIIDSLTVPYVSSWSYDTAGRLDTITYPNTGTAAAPKNLKVKYNYNATGYLQSITNATTSAVIYQRNSLNADGNTLSETYGNNTSQLYGYEPSTGRLQNIGLYGPGSNTPNLGNLSWSYDTLSNIGSRSDAITGVSESFGYDNLNRLTTVNLLQPTQTTPDTTSVTYNAIGNITSKNTTGTNVPLNLSISPANISQSAIAAGTMSGAVTVAVLASNAPSLPLTYSWAPSAATPVTVSPASGSTSGAALSFPASFSASVAAGTTASATYIVTVTDAAGRIGTASVPIAFTVTAPLGAVTLTPAALTASRNNPGAVSASTTVTYSGGATPYSLSWTRLTGSRISPPANTTGTTATSVAANFSATLGWAENLSEQFQVTVTDASAASKTANITVIFTSVAAPTVSISPTSLPISTTTSGGTASGTSTATGGGGIAPYTYAWSSISGSGISLNSTTAATPTFAANPTYGQTLTQSFQVTVTDAAGNTATAPTALTVTATGPAMPPAPTVSISPTSLPISNTSSGGLASGTAAATGASGLSPYTYNWSSISGSGISLNSTTAATPTFSATPTYAQTLTQSFQATVTDALGRTAAAPTALTVTATGPAIPPAPTVTISPASPISRTRGGAGSLAVTATATVANGATPLSYSWAPLPAGDAGFVLTGGTTNAATFTATLQACDILATSYRVTVTDALSRQATADVSVKYVATGGGAICPTPPPPGGGGN